MLFRVGRTFAVAACVSVVAIEFAAAADMPYVTNAPPAALPPSWAGFYLGGQVGYGADSVRWRNLGASAFFSPLNSVTRDHGSGVIGGGQLGYNFQYNRLVFGIDRHRPPISTAASPVRISPRPTCGPRGSPGSPR